MVPWLSTPSGTMATLWTGRGSGESTGGCRRRNMLAPLLHTLLNIRLLLRLPSHTTLHLRPCITLHQMIGRRMTVQNPNQPRASMCQHGDSPRLRRRHTPRRPTPVLDHQRAGIAVTTAACQLSTPHGRIHGITRGRLSAPKMT